MLVHMFENQNEFQVILQNNFSWFIRTEFGIYKRMIVWMFAFYGVELVDFYVLPQKVGY